MRETHVSLASVILCGGGLLITVKGIGDFYTSLKSRRGDVSLASAGRLLPQAATMQASAGLGAISLCSPLDWIGSNRRHLPRSLPSAALASSQIATCSLYGLCATNSRRIQTRRHAVIALHASSDRLLRQINKAQNTWHMPSTVNIV